MAASYTPCHVVQLCNRPQDRLEGRWWMPNVAVAWGRHRRPPFCLHASLSGRCCGCRIQVVATTATWWMSLVDPGVRQCPEPGRVDPGVCVAQARHACVCTLCPGAYGRLLLRFRAGVLLHVQCQCPNAQEWVVSTQLSPAALQLCCQPWVMTKHAAGAFYWPSTSSAGW
jgi:hypothetical protein